MFEMQLQATSVHKIAKLESERRSLLTRDVSQANASNSAVAVSAFRPSCDEIGFWKRQTNITYHWLYGSKWYMQRSFVLKIFVENVDRFRCSSGLNRD